MLKSINEKCCIGVSIISCLIKLDSIRNEPEADSEPQQCQFKSRYLKFLLRTTEVQGEKTIAVAFV